MVIQMKGGVGVERVCRKTRRGGAPGSTVVGELPASTAYPAEREAAARGVRGGVEIVEVVAGEPPGRHRMTGSGPVRCPSGCCSIHPSRQSHLHRERGSCWNFSQAFQSKSSWNLWLQRPIASPHTAPWTPQ